MKILWAIIAALFVASGYLLLRPGNSTPDGAGDVAPVAKDSAPATIDRTGPRAGPDAAAEVTQNPAANSVATIARPSLENPVNPPAVPAEAALDPKTLEAPAPASVPVDPLEELAAQALKGVIETKDQPSPAALANKDTDLPVKVAPATAPALPNPNESPATADLIPSSLPAHADFPPDKVVPAKSVVKGENGALRLDDRFVVRGGGTKDNPYVVPWDLLISAQEVYKPRSGLKKLPERVTFLHDSYVRITGFTAFPITSNNPKELLVMLYQWDGCCIGVPPTAFDAIEVTMSKVATDAQRLAVHGIIEGKLRVDPYEDGGWVLGLYLMQDATFTPD